MKNLGLYLKALGKHFWALMSCAVFTGISLVAAWKGKSNHWAVWMSELAAGILFLVASFSAWNDEHTAKESALAQQKLPHLTMNLHSLSWHPHPAKPNVLMVLTILSVRNTGIGAPSTLDSWKMELQGHPEVEIKPVTLGIPLVWHNSPWPYPVRDQIHKKIGEEPVPTGGKRTGFLLWNMTVLDPSILTGENYRPTFIITAKDVNGTLLTANDKMGKTRDDAMADYPGLSGPPSTRLSDFLG